MFAGELSFVNELDSRLRHIITKTNPTHFDQALRPPLLASTLDEEILGLARLTNVANENGNTGSAILPPSHTAFEAAARNVFYELLASRNIDDPSFGDVWTLLDIIQLCAAREQCDPSLALWLVEELLDSQTIQGCRRIFDYLESRRERLITNSINHNSKLIVLRYCNELLRRLSRAEDAVFCGRVFMFLFQSFPLGDKSSVNLRGEFHVENVTNFDDIQMNNVQEEDSEAMHVDSGAAEAPESTIEANGAEGSNGAGTGSETAPQGKKEDKKETSVGNAERFPAQTLSIEELYAIFWSLQRVFSNPPSVFANDALEKFKRGLEATIQKFRSVPKVPQARKPTLQSVEPSQGRKRKRGDAKHEFANTFNPKYLTSRDLFELELSDLTFQRHILVQALVLIDFLLSVTPKAKSKLSELKPQKAMQYTYTLTDEDEAWASKTRNDIASYLREGPGGPLYFRMVENVLARDKNWVRWKVESCPQIEMAPMQMADYMAAKSEAKKTSMSRRIRSAPMGALDLTFLSDKGNVNGLEKLVKTDVSNEKDPDQYLRDVQNVDLDLEMATEEEKLKLVEMRAAKTWRLLRLVARSKFKALEEIDEGKTETLEVLSAAAQLKADSNGDENEEKGAEPETKLDVEQEKMIEDDMPLVNHTGDLGQDVVVES